MVHGGEIGKNFQEIITQQTYQQGRKTGRREKTIKSRNTEEI